MEENIQIQSYFFEVAADKNSILNGSYYKEINAHISGNILNGDEPIILSPKAEEEACKDSNTPWLVTRHLVEIRYYYLAPFIDLQNSWQIKKQQVDKISYYKRCSSRSDSPNSQNSQSFLSFLQVPSRKQRFVFFINGVTKFTNLGDWYAHLLRNSPSQTIQIHVLGNILTSNPRNVVYMLKTEFLNYPKGKPFSMILGDLLGDGIFNVDGDLWMFERKMASLELGSMSIRSYAFNNVKNEIKFRLLPLLSSISQQDFGGTTLDLQDVFRRFSFDNICKFSFGLDPGCLELSLPLSDFAHSFDLATKLSAERAMASSPLIWKIKRLLNIGNEKKLRNAIENIDVLAREVIRQKRKLGRSNQQDLLSRFMTMVDNEVYLRDIVISFILAGRDTVASALTNIFWLLTGHPEVELRIREETIHVMQQNQEFLKFE
ncbi:hypothetical protein RND71_021992 [Anisodus tanguticus]|uniref:Cytochrome P450 n=1 Tax=Anisodus tanguticus TaxID=243964 RepID=A0AAE1RZ50_9SOLA|nr:hypothetical protein RND71_021992 [Anisodus tanguticus]